MGDNLVPERVAIQSRWLAEIGLARLGFPGSVIGDDGYRHRADDHWRDPGLGVKSMQSYLLRWQNTGH